MRMRYCIFSLLLAPVIAQAEIYKCTISGRLVLQSAPCPGMPDEPAESFSAPAHTAALPALPRQPSAPFVDPEVTAREERRVAWRLAVHTLVALNGRFLATARLAASTPRIALPGPIQTLQDVAQDAQAVSVPDCLLEAKRPLMQSMAVMIDGFTAFLRSSRTGRFVAERSFRDAEKLVGDFAHYAGNCQP